MTDTFAFTTKKLANRNVLAVRGKKDKARRIGKVRRFVFHPSEKRLVGFIVKRPDRVLMFHRSDLFVALDSVEFSEEGLLVTNESTGTGSAAINRLQLDWDRCVMWVGMQLVTQNGTPLGHVGTVDFDPATGKVLCLQVDEGATAHALLGDTKVPPSMILGFRWGVGDKLRDLDDGIDQEEAHGESADWERGAILLSDEALDLCPEGGLAEAAARGSVMAVKRTKETASALKDKAVEAASSLKGQAEQKAEELKPAAEAKIEDLKPKVEAKKDDLKPVVDQATAAVKQKQEEATATVKPVAKEVARKTGEAVNKGAFALGKQLGKSSSMFSGFMDEYRKALNDDDEGKR